MPARPSAGDGMLHPVPLAAVAVLLLNDHVLKARFPGVVTGKLSDVAGLVFFPLLLVALVELWLRATRRFTAPSQVVLWVALWATGLAFAASKTWEPAGDAYRLAWALLQWPARAVAAWLRGLPLPPVGHVRHMVDPTDLLALPSLALAWAVGRRRL